MWGTSARAIGIFACLASMHLACTVAEAGFVYTEDFESGDGGW